MKARAFFYGCAGLFLLALSYHLGAGRAGAQAAAFRVLNAGGTLVIEYEGAIYSFTGSGWAVPSSLPPGSLLAGDGGTFITTEGITWRADGGGGWTSYNLPGGTPATRETWGALKSRYRGAARVAR